MNILKTAPYLSLFAAASLLGGVLYFMTNSFHTSHSAELDQINVFIPFTLTTEINPRSVKTVGDQTVSEHVFAFHSREDVRDGYASVVSEVKFNRSEQTILIQPKYPLRTSTGESVTLQQICDSIRTSFEGTQHAPYRSLLKSVDCGSRGAEVKLQSIPVNMEFLFTIPDFSIYQLTQVPITPLRLYPSAGPYQIESLSTKRVDLKRNKYYPAALTANQIEKVRIEHFEAGAAKEFVGNANPDLHHLTYFQGHSVTPPDLDVLASRGFRIQKFPSEWITYVGFNPSVPKEDREQIAKVIDQNRPELMKEASLGQAAFSIPPSDRPFGLSEIEYLKVKPTVPKGPLKLSKPLKIGTRAEWYEIPIFRKTIHKLKDAFPTLETVTVKSSVYSGPDTAGHYEADIYLTALGISPADPLSHIAYLTSSAPNFKGFLSDLQQAEVATMSNATEFIRTIKEIETRILHERLIIPLAHFPGIVVEAPRFKRDSDLAWSWGIQAWTYRIDK